MKNKLLFLLAALCVVFVGCNSTPQQAAATGIYAAGYAAASDNLNHDASLEPVIRDVAAKLPLINSGKLTATDMGVLSGELQKLARNTDHLAKLVPQDSAKLEQAAAFLAGVLQSNAALNGGKAPTVDQVVATTALIGFCNGLVDGIDYWKGRKSVTARADFYPGYVVK